MADLKPGPKEDVRVRDFITLLRRKFAERRLPQTPQCEGGNMNLVLFGFDTVSPPSKSVEIAEVKKLEGFTTKVVLQGGWLQGIVNGEYDVYDPELTDDMVDSKEVEDLWMAHIDVNPDDIEAIKSYGTVLYTHYTGPKKLIQIVLPVEKEMFDPPYAIPTFQAHRVELVTPSRHRKFYRAVDGTGDALVIEVTNNEKFPIHICVMSYQADGSIVVLYPPKKGATEVLKPGESATEIRRILLHPDTVRRMVEPDFNVERPDGCNDALILYATTEQTVYEPLTQGAVELSPHLSTRGINSPHGWRLASVKEFRDALESQAMERENVRGNLKWLTMKREIRVLYNKDQEPVS
ncbi:uncharacterized protein [Montipora capricornis]|uniref:uncharacterized protein n=1 Tax=Montipora capricornis TaxID=246305 RepID=UPI0035F13FD9